MKTKNNVQKITLKSFAVIATLVLVSITVSAQDFWKDFISQSSFIEIADAMKKKHETFIREMDSKNLVAEFMPGNISVVETEDALKLEPWMTDESYFNTTSIESSVESDKALQLENWMIDNKYFNTENATKKSDNSSVSPENIEKEGNLELQTWMTDSRIWK